MALSTERLRELYERLARRYDSILATYLVAGLRAKHHRGRAVAALKLKRGDIVVVLGCGTGLNFPLLEDAVGTEGRIIGVDITPGMLDRARRRIHVSKWENVDLVQADISDYSFPPAVNGIISTYAITLAPRYDDAIHRAAAALRPGARMVILDLKRPANWPEWLIRFGAWLTRPFGVTLDLSERHPWESLRRHMREISFTEHCFGGAYLAVAEPRLSPDPIPRTSHVSVG